MCSKSNWRNSLLLTPVGLAGSHNGWLYRGCSRNIEKIYLKHKKTEVPTILIHTFPLSKWAWFCLMWKQDTEKRVFNSKLKLSSKSMSKTNCFIKSRVQARTWVAGELHGFLRLETWSFQAVEMKTKHVWKMTVLLLFECLHTVSHKGAETQCQTRAYSEREKIASREWDWRNVTHLFCSLPSLPWHLFL